MNPRFCFRLQLWTSSSRETTAYDGDGDGSITTVNYYNCLERLFFVSYPLFTPTHRYRSVVRPRLEQLSVH